ncbi:MAG: UvrD-helicase domain-containing protein [Patescibacteria group bacterium]
MLKDFLKDLNPEQQQAVLYTDGPSIILAGAGSGKTRVLTYKVVYLIQEKGVDPSNILMVTFTNKAANEMKERIQKFIPGTSAIATTFHSLCNRILRRDGVHIGVFPNFAIYDDHDQIDTVKEAMKMLNISNRDFKPSSVMANISQAKNELITEAEYPSFARGHFQETVAKIYTVYQKLLKENNALDFDDLILKTIYLFDTNPQILSKYQKQFEYVLVDEYQDTNKAQYLLTKLFSGGKDIANICVVGDFSQSIYSWRGADFLNLSKFKDDFENVSTFALSQNYRSTQKILDAAGAIISKNTSHPVLNLWTENPKGEDISLYEASNEHNEGEFIVNQIAEFKYKNPNLKFSDFAVLYRTNAQSRSIEEVFLHKSLPYVLIGGTRFYDRKEIKDVLAYLKAIANPKDKVSLKRIEKLGKGRFKKFEAFQSTFDENQISEISTLEIMDSILTVADYLSLYDEKDEEDRSRLENIKELRSVAVEFPNLHQFLENVALVEDHNPKKRSQEKEDDSNGGQVNLMTLHAAKGLEFPVVFMVGMEEGLFPHSRSAMDKSELEEERRLCYVGMTRAMDKLFLTYSRKRLFFGQRTSNMISRFILELPEQTLENNAYIFDRKSEEYL